MRYGAGFMRTQFRLLGLCALAVVAFGGCFGFDWDWDHDPCEGVVCPDDGNVCTDEYCSGGKCVIALAENGRQCTYDGLQGVCVEGECGENLCEGVVCDDENACTEDYCDYVDASCYVEPVSCDDENECTDDACDPAVGCTFTSVDDGTFCFDGVCKAGSCVLPTDACTNAEDLAIVCDAGFMDETEECAGPAGIIVAICLVENTGVSADCAACYGAAIQCVFTNCLHVCAPGLDAQPCEDCMVEAGCYMLLDDCTGDLGSTCETEVALLGDVGAFEVQP